MSTFGKLKLSLDHFLYAKSNKYRSKRGFGLDISRGCTIGK